MGLALYNEIEPFAAAWLEELVKRGAIAPGRVDRRSIAELTPDDVAGPGQRHFFAGIGVWSYALRLARIPDDVSVWTGSCPCQPFSCAGKRGGFDDPRHLWPAWFSLIRECRPSVVFGEQTPGPDGLAWLDLVQADLEGAGYAVGAADLCAAGIGAPHRRQRLYFVAYADEGGRGIIRSSRLHDHGQPGIYAARCGPSRGVADALLAGRTEGRPESGGGSTSGCCSASELADAEAIRRGARWRPEPHGRSTIKPDGHGVTGNVGDATQHELARPAGRRKVARAEAEGTSRLDGDHGAQYAGPVSGFWADAEWIPCLDGFSRSVEPGTFPLAHGAPARVGRLRGYGNGLVSEQAATFIEAAIAAACDVT